MVNFKIFKTAFGRYQGGEVYFIRANQHQAWFIVDDVEVVFEITKTGTKFICQCEHHKNHMLQDKLCSRVIAVMVYLYFKRGKIKDE